MGKDLILYITAASCYMHNDGEMLKTLAREGGKCEVCRNGKTDPFGQGQKK